MEGRGVVGNGAEGSGVDGMGVVGMGAVGRGVVGVWETAKLALMSAGVCKTAG